MIVVSEQSTNICGVLFLFFPLHRLVVLLSETWMKGFEFYKGWKQCSDFFDARRKHSKRVLVNTLNPASQGLIVNSQHLINYFE